LNGKATASEKVASQPFDTLGAFDHERIEQDPSVENIRKIFTVESLVKFCEHKLQST